MPVNHDEAVQAVVLRAPDGAMYAVPESVVQRWRLPDEVADTLQAETQVSSYLMATPRGFQSLGGGTLTGPFGLRGATSASDAGPTEQITFTYGALQVHYTQQSS